jgi:hypothetical protein
VHRVGREFLPQISFLTLYEYRGRIQRYRVDLPSLTILLALQMCKKSWRFCGHPSGRVILEKWRDASRVKKYDLLGARKLGLLTRHWRHVVQYEAPAWSSENAPSRSAEAVVKDRLVLPWGLWKFL